MSTKTFHVDESGVIYFAGYPFAAVDWGYNVPEERVRIQNLLDSVTSVYSVVSPPANIAGPRAFVLQRDEDETGVSGVGIVAEGVCFTDGTVSLRWTSDWPTSVVFHDRGMDSVEAVHGHGGKTQVMWQ